MVRKKATKRHSQTRNTWVFHDKPFQYQPMMDDFSEGWSGLRRFGYDLVAYMKPASITELGVYRGTSFCAFLQAIKDKKLKTKVTGVDTWEGDLHTGFYADKILKNLKSMIKKYYSSVPVTLTRKTFDDAVPSIKKGSIDLLHIDGLHTYEAAKHDYETWKHTVSDKGVILFHDIHYFERNFGVYKLWDELKKKHYTLELKHSNGLGIVIMDKDMFNELKELEPFWQTYYPVKAQADELTYQVKDDVSQKRIKELKKIISETEQQVVHLQRDKEELQRQLDVITSAKFYKIWQSYCNLRDSIIGKKTND